ncbi:hypothetical protein [Paenibacillus taiwanensis]|uniref:hypothetical protein n=1 Tax=Paenibacillus taiwanensis TaxID=401638 RepID=UPI0003F4F14C|nr:hypothetical protein [Paenibacillus taiwanensis]
MNRNTAMAITVAITCGALLTGCGQSNLSKGQQPDSFAAAATSAATHNKVVSAAKETPIEYPASSGNADVKNLPESIVGSSKEQTNSASEKKELDASASTTRNSKKSSAAAPDTNVTRESETVRHQSADSVRTTSPKSSKSEGSSATAQTSAQVKGTQTAANNNTLKKPTPAQGRHSDSQSKAAETPSKPAVQQPADKTYSSTLLWSEFFDNEKQNTPSEKFWELSGKQVTIKGYMGEVLSFDKNWFLLIPAPGAECPFDNGDETYWNKIMMVFVPNDTKLRYTSGPLELTGTLDVGIKIDESGYKTMFRLYDTSFEKISE